MHAKSAAAMCAISTFLTLNPAFAEQPSPSAAAMTHTASNESSKASPQDGSDPAKPSPVVQGSDAALRGNAARANAARAPRSASGADRAAYAARENASPGAQVYQGGDSVVVIGASTATVILAVILLVVLI